MSSISQITGQMGAAQSKPKVQEAQDGFGDTLKNLLNDVNGTMKEAGSMAEKFATGEVGEIHDVMIAAQKASVGLEMVVEIRNKLMESYRELMRMQI